MRSIIAVKAHAGYIYFMHCEPHSSIQTVFARSATGYIGRELPPADQALAMDGLLWGLAEEICSPAYWAAQAWIWEVEAPDHYKLGRSLDEELIACLLGGYGIPAEVGLAAYERLRIVNAEDPAALRNEEVVLALLEEPLAVEGRSVRYRFAKQKAGYLAGSMRQLLQVDQEASDRDLRDALTALPGIGPKTASWIVRNWRDSDCVSILDIHILRAGRILRIFPESWSVERHYLQLEGAFLRFADAISVKASILDSVMWMNMRQLPAAIVRKLIDPDSVIPEPSRRAPMQFELAL
jgi:thermostable 8-oxoguanine DNA glycosylase